MRSTLRRAYVSNASLITPMQTVPIIAWRFDSTPAFSKIIGEW